MPTMNPKTQERLEIASVVIAGIGLLYILFHKTPAANNVGSSVPVLMGSGGDSGGSGLSPTSGDQGATTLAPITIPTNPAITAGSIYAPNLVQTFLGTLANPNMSPFGGSGGGGGCCGQSQPVPYVSAPAPAPAAVNTDPATYYAPPEEGYPNVYDFGYSVGA